MWHTEWLISAGTRTRSLWIRSPARYSIAPQRLRQDNPVLARFTYFISSHIVALRILAASGPVWADMLALAGGGHQRALLPHAEVRQVSTSVRREVELECSKIKVRSERVNVFITETFILKAWHQETRFIWASLALDAQAASLEPKWRPSVLSFHIIFIRVCVVDLET